jgi:hypothetical protein
MIETIAIGIVLVTFAYAAADRAVMAVGGAGSGASAAAQARRFGRIEVALYALLAMSVAALAITGFAGYLAVGHVRGWLLIGHMMAGGLFSVVLPLFLLAFAEAARFDRATRGPLGNSEKVIFWLAMIAGGVSLGTIVVTMVPLLGTHAIETMMTLHRYSGLVMVVLAAPQVYIMNWQKRKQT